MRRAAALVALCSTALLAGCGGDGAPSSATNVETRAAGPSIPAGFTVRVVKDEGFSIGLPKSWRSLDAQEALNSGTMKQFQKANPQLTDQLQALAQANSPLKLLAIGPSGDDNFVANLNVIETRIPSDLDFDEWTSAEIKEIEKVPSVKKVRQEETQLQPGRALHLDYRASFNRSSGSFDVHVHQWMVRNEGLLYILTYTTSPAREPMQRQMFDDSAHTFRVTG